MRGWLTCLVVLALVMLTPTQKSQIALAADYEEELEWSQMEIQLLGGNGLEWQLDDAVKESMESPIVEVTENVEIEASVADALENVKYEAPIYTEAKTLRDLEPPKPLWRITLTHEQLDLLERCVMAEGGGESYECQVAIACVIINRVLDDAYPDTVDGVIKQRGQFSTWPSHIERVVPTDEVKQAVREALTEAVIPEDVLFFRADRYHSWATNYCRLDNTYFSKPR